jgi:hypothetical protein
MEGIWLATIDVRFRKLGTSDESSVTCDDIGTLSVAWRSTVNVAEPIPSVRR